MNQGSILLLTGLLASTAASATHAGPSIIVDHVWSRPATGNAVVYAAIRNGGGAADELIEAQSTAAAHTELHESTAEQGQSMPDMPGMSGMKPAPMMSMKKVGAITIPAGEQVTLKPGGYHIMLIGLKRPWKLGDTFAIRLHFKRMGWIATNGTVSGE